jgi:hypothetical protein
MTSGHAIGQPYEAPAIAERTTVPSPLVLISGGSAVFRPDPEVPGDQ